MKLIETGFVLISLLISHGALFILGVFSKFMEKHYWKAFHAGQEDIEKAKQALEATDDLLDPNR